ncbi:MAG: hypothetical protein QOJ59_4619 [Thermomicrobiales bacterium]|jgi:hypothetical protein|nr:hypothetical protein [Thermomicrobiales bacterium]
MPDVQDRASETVHAVREQAAALAREIAEQAATRVVAGAERARGVGSSLTAETTSRVRDVPHKVSDEVVPSLREVAVNAAAAALELWQAARDKAAEAAEAGQAGVGEAAHLVGAAEKRAKDATTAVVGRVEGVGGKAKEATSAVAGRVEGVGGKAKEASAHAAEATVETSKDTGAALLWGAAAGAVIFYVILSEERRQQVLRIADTVIKQSREIIRDFQGYDEEFA